MTKKTEPEDHDIVLMHSPTEDGEGYNALRSRPGRLDLAEIRPVREGSDVSRNEVISLKPRDEAPFMADVETVYSPEEIEENHRSLGGHAGPPRIATRAYRDNWSGIFRSKTRNKNTLLN